MKIELPQLLWYGNTTLEIELPEDWVAQGMLMIGYGAEEPAFRVRKPMAEVVHWVS